MKYKITAKEGFFKTFFCCFFILSALLLSAQVFQGIDLQTAQAERLLEENQPDEALEILAALYPQAAAAEDKTQLEFLMAMASMAKKDYATAEWVFRRILKNRPDLYRVRLELALLYFVTGQNEKADYHFRLVLGRADLPQEVKNKIFFFLAQIRYRRRWDWYLNFGIAPNSNINNASGLEAECIDFYGIPLCRDVEGRRSSVGISGAGGVSFYNRLSPNFRWRSSVSGTMSDFSGKDYDLYSVTAATGPLYNFIKGSAGVYAAADRVWFAGRGLFYAVGPSLQTSYDVLPRVSLSFNAYRKWQTFDASGFDSMDGTDTMFAPGVSYALTSSSYLLFRFSADFLRTQELRYDKNTYRYAVGYGTELPLGLSLYLEGGIATSASRGEGLFIENGAFVLKRRSDETYSFDVRLLNRQINLWSFTPTLNYSYIRNNSNTVLGSYDKHIIELGITRRF